MDDGRLHRSGLRIIDGGLAGERRAQPRAIAPRCLVERPAFKTLEVVVSYLELPGADAPAILILPTERHQLLTHNDWRLIERCIARSRSQEP